MPFSVCACIERCRIWLKVDADGDGQLSKTEVTAVLKAMPWRDSDAHSVQRVMAAMDVDRDGCIDISEFEDWYACVCLSQAA